MFFSPVSNHFSLFCLKTVIRIDKISASVAKEEGRQKFVYQAQMSILWDKDVLFFRFGTCHLAFACFNLWAFPHLCQRSATPQFNRVDRFLLWNVEFFSVFSERATKCTIASQRNGTRVTFLGKEIKFRDFSSTLLFNELKKIWSYL